MTIGRLIDVSSNQHPNGAPIDWDAVARDGVAGAFIKATQGTTYRNPYYSSDVAGATKAGILTIAYHYAGMGDVAGEARFFKAVAGTKAQMLDFETFTNVPWARTFLQTLGWTHDQCMTYGSASSLVDIYKQLPSRAWPAAYGQGYPGWGVLWQFTSSATIPGIVGPVDENRWYGSEIQYETLFGLLEPPPPIPAPPIPEGSIEMDSQVAPNGDIVGHYRTPQNHLLEVTRKAGQQGDPATQGLEIIDITAQYPQFTVQP